MAPRRRSRSLKRISYSLHTTIWTWVFIIGLVIGVFVTVYATGKSTELRKSATVCSDNNCQNIKAGNLWMITNCQTGTSTPVKQYCNLRGITAVCRGITYCCPSAGAQWTKDMASCPMAGAPATAANLAIIPSIAEPTPAAGFRQLTLTVSPFTNSAGQGPARPAIWGTSEPGAMVTVSILPDGVNGRVTVDTSGKWMWQSDKTLTNGDKDLLVVAKTEDGQGQVKQGFTVVGGSSGGISLGIIFLIMAVVGLGFGGFVLIKTRNITQQKK
jgi:hypothetical protein